jgi:hypothetical protein
MVFVIFVFSENHVENLLRFLENNMPFLRGTLSDLLQKQKKLLHAPLGIKEVKLKLIFKVLGRKTPYCSNLGCGYYSYDCILQCFNHQLIS